MSRLRSKVLAKAPAALLVALSLLWTTAVFAETGPRRIVSIGGAVTEIIFALGLDEQIVAVDTTSNYPEAVSEKPSVGYMRRLSAEPILSLNPELVFAVEGSGPPQALEQLRASGVPLVMVPNRPHPEGVLEKIRVISATLGVEAKGQALENRLRSDFKALEGVLSGVSERPSVLFLMSVGRGAPISAGQETAPDSIVTLAGGRNAVSTFEGYKPLSPEAIVAAAPDVLLLTRRAKGMLGSEEKILELPALASTPAVRDGRIVVLDALLLLGFGPRTGDAVRSLARQLHPELEL